MSKRKSKPAGYYVYALVDPLNGDAFYIGKGKGLRYLDHVIEHEKYHRRSNEAKHLKIEEILDRGDTVQHCILLEGLTEEVALKFESRIISTRRHTLTNGNNRVPRAIPLAVDAHRQLANWPSFEAWVKPKYAENPMARHAYALIHATLELFAYGKPIPAGLYPVT